MHNALYHAAEQSSCKILQRERNDNRLAAVGDENYPIVITTYRLTEHHVSGPMTRWMPWLNALQPALFAEISPELAAERKIKHGDWMVISTPRGEIEARAMVTRRMRPLQVHGPRGSSDRLAVPLGLPGQESQGSITNDLAHMVLEPNVSIEEAKAFTCNVRPWTPTLKERGLWRLNRTAHTENSQRQNSTEIRIIHNGSRCATARIHLCRQ